MDMKAARAGWRFQPPSVQRESGCNTPPAGNLKFPGNCEPGVVEGGGGGYPWQISPADFQDQGDDCKCLTLSSQGLNFFHFFAQVGMEWVPTRKIDV